jgi:hypothetical protein
LVFQRPEAWLRVFFVLLLPLLLACSADDGSIVSEEVQIAVEHYKTTSLLNGTAFIISETSGVGNAGTRVRGQIDGFDFEPGYSYRLKTNKKIIKNSGTNAKTIRYELIEVLEKQPVAPFSEFRIPLITFVNGQGTVSFLSRRPDSTFILSNEIIIDCELRCGDLNAAFDSNQLVTGVFRHGDAGSYVLNELQ